MSKQDRIFGLIAKNLDINLDDKDIADLSVVSHIYELYCDECSVDIDSDMWDVDTFESVYTHIVLSKLEMDTKAKWLQR